MLSHLGPITQLPNNAQTMLPIVAICLGSVVFIIAFMGCCGALRENNCMMMTVSTSKTSAIFFTTYESLSVLLPFAGTVDLSSCVCRDGLGLPKPIAGRIRQCVRLSLETKRHRASSHGLLPNCGKYIDFSFILEILYL